MKKLIPLVFMLVGIGGGVGAGLALRPDTAAVPGDAEQAEQASPSEAGHDTAAQDTHGSESTNGHGADSGHDGGLEYIKLNNQFVVPIVEKDSVEALIVMSLSLEVTSGQSETVYLREPKLRDEFLQVMFDHANMGGFRGTFTDTEKLDVLRRGFLNVAEGVLGPVVTAVLITDITRQKM